MRFDPEPLQGTFVRRYKRFFADVILDGVGPVTAHCPNTGRLTGCLVEGAPVLVKPANNPKRKLKYTWVAIKLGGRWVGVDTSVSNKLAAEALSAGTIEELSGYKSMSQEVRYGKDLRSRIDLLLHYADTPCKAPKNTSGVPRVYVEVKNTTLVFDEEGERVGAFPDAPTERGRKHLSELIDVVRKGDRAAMLYCLQRNDCVAIRPADEIDPEYGRLLREAVDAGVEIYALGARIGPKSVRLVKRLPIRL